MLDFSHVLATPGLDAQYFQGPGWTATTSNALSISSLGTSGVVTTAAPYTLQVGQAIQITGTFASGAITGWTSGAYYYITTVSSTNQFTISATPGGASVTTTASGGAPGPTFTLVTPQWQTWRKPRGVKWIYMLAVGGGASGGTGINTANSGGAGAGGGSGSQTVVMIPAMFVPDVLYIACGNGGASQTASGVPGLPGLPTYVAIEADTGMDFNKNILWTNPGNVGGTPASTVGGLGGTAASAAIIGYMPLAGRGFYTQIAGQPGGAGGTTGGSASGLTLSSSGLMVSGGTGGGGSAGASGGSILAPVGSLGTDFFASLPALSGAVTSTPGQAGANFIARNFIMNYGGTGGGGATITAGGSAGAGGDGAPGSGGGGSGGATSTNPILRSGAGGPGFVLILSW
jgi:hypothetical protein